MSLKFFHWNKVAIILNIFTSYSINANHYTTRLSFTKIIFIFKTLNL
jgi:hypothetical protein